MKTLDVYYKNIQLEELDAIAQLLADKILSWENYGMVLLSGELGCGKTTLIRLILEKLGVRDVVNSPTFAIMNMYEAHLPNQWKAKIFHFDFYRIQSADELMELGFQELWGREGHSFIEWYDRFSIQYPYPQLVVQWEEPIDFNSRNIRIQEWNPKN